MVFSINLSVKANEKVRKYIDLTAVEKAVIIKRQREVGKWRITL